MGINKMMPKDDLDFLYIILYKSYASLKYLFRMLIIYLVMNEFQLLDLVISVNKKQIKTFSMLSHFRDLHLVIGLVMPDDGVLNPFKHSYLEY